VKVGIEVRMNASAKILIGLGATLLAAMLLYGPLGFGHYCVVATTVVAGDLTSASTPLQDTGMFASFPNAFTPSLVAFLAGLLIAMVAWGGRQPRQD